MTNDDHITPAPYALNPFIVRVTGENATALHRRGDAPYEARVRTMGIPDSVYVGLIGDGGEDPTTGQGFEYPVANCANCHMPLNSENEAMSDSNGSSDPKVCIDYAENVDGPHIPVPIPLSWANNASIHLDAERDRIMVGISVADPRGGFTLEIRREMIGDICGCDLTWDEKLEDHVYTRNGVRCPLCEGTGFINRRYELRLSLPHHTDGQLHAPLTDLNGRGYYKIGS